MTQEKPSLTPSDSEKIRDKLAECIATLDRSAKALGEAERRLKARLVQLHAEVERLSDDSTPPFPR